MKVLFRCDISPEIGAGHLRRCSVLAGELKRRGGRTLFVCRSRGNDPEKELDGAADDCRNLDWSLSAADDARRVIRICRQEGMDLAVIDHYRADEEYQRPLFHEGVRWLQCDWAASGPLWADWVLNPSPGANECAYRGLARRKETRLLLGPAYAWLRPGFHSVRKDTTMHQVRKILITLGGGDDRGGTLLCMDALKRVGGDREWTVLVGNFNPRLRQIEKWVGENRLANVTVVAGERDVARRMREADIAVIGGGTTTFEAAAMGLPCVIVRIAENQSMNAISWERAGVAIDAGPLGGLTADALARHLRRLMDDEKLRRNMSSAGIALVDGRGTERTADALSGG
ncbi:MAG: UDP-2,4-diacetamido-2,4,6-trideoxy-beta-L-altropyranose hydrolase [Candidatus Aureabacteria bacterium]|nr:UDP-2,4-diacetamido-2,4,6-trideoxy-beta-L-altropyranose hydrolase [Candidatus Auribacterota bacterium]